MSPETAEVMFSIAAVPTTRVSTMSINTGLDQPVIDFLEKDGEILAFLESVYRLVDHHVERFIERDFSHLQVAFGCTGGQHRSVYCAEHLAQHLHEKYGIEIHLIHRERGIDKCVR